MPKESTEIVMPDAEWYLPNGWVDPSPHNENQGGCFLQCCVPEAYDEPIFWYCQNSNCRTNNGGRFIAKLHQPGECINCWPPESATWLPRHALLRCKGPAKLWRGPDCLGARC